MKIITAAAAIALGAFALQQPAAVPPVAAAAEDAGRYIGVASCVSSGCHGSTQPLRVSSVLQNEYHTWLSSDRHAQAYNVLFNERSARIARNMRLQKKPYEEAVCLDCHTTNVPASLVKGSIDPEDGVQCEACHGPASGWRDRHMVEGWTRAQSVAAGMIDLRNLTRRASLCLGCHLGDQRKEVDHELIASGHPVLTFELDNYTASMPPHWDPQRADDGIAAWAVGQAAMFHQSLENLARHAQSEKWPEFGDMSCTPCHHSLAESGWRQERGWAARAGLPAWSPRHWAVLRVIIGRVSPSARAELDPLVREVSSAVSRMNDRQAVVDSALRARRVMDQVVPRVEAATWTAGDVMALMRTVANRPEPVVAEDVQAAEQTALALQSLWSVLTRRDARLLTSPAAKAIDALFAELQDREAFDHRRFTLRLTELRASLGS